MHSGYLFLLVCIGLAAAALLAVFKKPKHMINYFKTKEGKGVLFGIVAFIGAGAIIVFASSAMAKAHDYKTGSWFNYGEVFLGMDNTNKQSPQCHDGNNSSRLTSNGGLRFNIYESGDERFSFNTKYTHHSCAFNSDNKSYDAIGLEASYKFFVR